MSAVVDEELWFGSSASEEAEERAAASLAGRVGRVLGAKPFPASALKLARLTRDPRSQMEDLLAVLESDPALSARLLRLVNSAGFALRMACTSVRHAAVLVGNARLNQVATTAAIMDMYASSAKHATRVLEHASVVGALCRYLAFYLALPSDELFTCGFLHDIGKLMLLDTDGTVYEQLLDEAGDDADRIHLLERERFGFDHALLAGHVLAKWNIPEPVPQVVSWHHNAAHAFSVSPKLGQLVSAVRLADAMSYAFRAGKPDVSIEQLSKTDAAQYLGVSEPQIAAMWDEMAALALRAIAASRGGSGAAETFSMRPSTASLRVVRGSLSAPARRSAARALAVSEAPGIVTGERTPQSLFPDALSTSKRPSGADTVTSSTPPVFSVPVAAKLRESPSNDTNDVSTPIPPSLPAPPGGSWVPGQSRVPEPPQPLPSIAAPPSPRPAGSLRPTKLQPAALEDIRPEMAAVSPKQFPCIVCDAPTYAATCTACGAYVCPKHQLGEDAWCAHCVQDYEKFQPKGFPQWVILAVGCSYGLLIAVAAFTTHGDVATRWLSALALAAMLSLLLVVARRGLRRSRFLRSRTRRLAASEPASRGMPLEPTRNLMHSVESAGADLALSEPMPSTLPGVVRPSELPFEAGAVARTPVAKVEPQIPLERIVPQVDAGVMHLQALLRGNPDAGTELEAQQAQRELEERRKPPSQHAQTAALRQEPAPDARGVEEPPSLEGDRDFDRTRPRAAAALAARRLGRARAPARRSFWKPRAR